MPQDLWAHSCGYRGGGAWCAYLLPPDIGSLPSPTASSQGRPYRSSKMACSPILSGEKLLAGECMVAANSSPTQSSNAHPALSSCHRQADALPHSHPCTLLHLLIHSLSHPHSNLWPQDAEYPLLPGAYSQGGPCGSSKMVDSPCIFYFI